MTGDTTKTAGPRPSLRSWTFLHIVTSVVLLVTAAVLTYWRFLPPDEVVRGALPKELQPYLDAHVLGSQTASVVLIVYSDFECPYCKRFATEVLPEVRQRYVETGRVSIAFRHFPLQRHKFALVAARASVCAAAQGRFWQTHDQLFLLPNPLTLNSILEATRLAGVDRSGLDACLSQGGDDAVARDLTLGQVAGVSGTPYLLLGTPSSDGVSVQEVVNGLPTFTALSRRLESVLARGGS